MVDLFETLENDISHYTELGDVAVFCDFNGRIGLKPDFILCDRYTEEIDDNGYMPGFALSRVSSEDTGCNAQ